MKSFLVKGSQIVVASFMILAFLVISSSPVNAVSGEITNVYNNDITSIGSIVNFSIDVATKCMVEYNAVGASINDIMSTGWTTFYDSNPLHRIWVHQGIKPGTKYYYSITCKDENGNVYGTNSLNSSGDNVYSFTSLPSLFTSPDLAVKSISLDRSVEHDSYPKIGDTYQVNAGDSVILKAEIKNVGTATNDSLMINVYMENSLSSEEKLINSQVYFRADGGSLAPDSSIVYKFGIDSSNFAEGKNTITVKVIDNTRQDDSVGIYSDNNHGNDQLSASVAYSKPTKIPNLAVAFLDIPEKVVLGMPVLVKATIKDYNLSNITSYSITTSVLDSQNINTVVDERIYSDGTIGAEGIIYKFNIDASKFKLGDNTITVQVDDDGDNEVILENNSLSKTMSVVKADMGAKEVISQRYGNGVLLKSKSSGRVYLIKSRMKYYISTLQELKKYRGNAIYTVDDSTLSAYADYNIKPYSDGVLLISKTTGRVYLIKNKMKYYISTLEELGRYRGSKTFRVEEGVLNAYANFK